MNRLMLQIVLLLSCPLVAADVYKWTDAQGRVHYSDRPMSDASQPLKVTPAPPISDPSTHQVDRKRLRQRMLDVYREERTQKRQLLAEQKQEKAKRKRMCHQSRDRYESFSSSSAIYDRDENGERRYLENKERKRFIAKLKSDVDRWCAK
ncbi:MAG: DUF4124 domain-containing protein [Pseudomonadota bacterium]